MEQGSTAPMPGAPPEQKKGGFSFLKCCLIVGCLAVVIGGGAMAFLAYKASQAFTMDPVKVQNIASEIVPCEAPAGYQGFMGVNVLGVKMAMIGPAGMMQGKVQPGGAPLMIVVMAQPQKTTQEQLKQEASKKLKEHQNAELAAEKAEDETLVVRGKPTKVEKALSKDNQGNNVLMYMLILEQEPTSTNPAGQEIIMLMGGEKQFDKKAMEAFLGSIK